MNECEKVKNAEQDGSRDHLFEEERRKKKKEGERERKIRFETELVIKYCVKRLLVIISQKKNFLILNYSAIWHHPDLERDEKAEKRR